ncbi:MAG: TetR/AcrR family transcriptional regulator, partial [Dethiobacteria bacterium]
MIWRCGSGPSFKGALFEGGKGGCRVEDRKKENRFKILEAAGELFYYRRFHEVRMEEIAEAAGMGKGTIYE